MVRSPRAAAAAAEMRRLKQNAQEHQKKARTHKERAVLDVENLIALGCFGCG